MRVDTIIINKERNVFLNTYIQPVGGKFYNIEKRPAIIILPGGGYSYCSTREAEPVAFAYLKAGFQVFILNYSVSEFATWPNPLNDFDDAMALIKERKEEFNVDLNKIAVIGFSAGGHLAAAAATMAKNRPNAAILGYAVCGDDVEGCNPGAPDTTKYVDRNTCPCFVFATRTDALVPIDNSINFLAALTKHEIAYESHIYAYGPHGFSTCDSSVQSIDTEICSRVPNWVNDSIGWLKDMFGDFKEEGFSEPKCSRYSTHDYDEYLNCDCSFKHLLNNEEGNKIVRDVAKELNIDFDFDNPKLIGKMSLRAFLEFIKKDQEYINNIDKRLNLIINK